MSKELKAQDLRIGNLINEGFVLEISKNTILVADGNSEQEFTIGEINGIPLTEDWLVKFGFEKDGVFCDYILKLFDEKILGYELSHSYLYLAQNFRDVNLGEFKYLHDLQNLYYALTQTELTLKESNVQSAT